jgi:hypothetical protein
VRRCAPPARAHAALVDRGGGLVYDTVLDITWLADMNHARTQYDNSGGALGTADGQMEWLQANIWAHELVYGGYTDWRLPAVLQPDPSCSIQIDPGDGSGVRSSGTGCVGSEMGHLFYIDLGGEAGESVLDATGDTAQEAANLALFTNVQSSLYWSSTNYAPDNEFAWAFWTANGLQSAPQQGLPAACDGGAPRRLDQHRGRTFSRCAGPGGAGPAGRPAHARCSGRRGVHAPGAHGMTARRTSRCSCRRSARRWARLAPAVLVCTTTAASADVTWTGDSLLGPYWHNALNWAGGQLPDSNDRAFLGNADTFINQGQFVRSFQGSGTLTIQNSFLGMYGPPGVGSLIGTLRLEDSTIAGFESRVRAGHLWLQNATLGDVFDGSTSELRANDSATLTGSLTLQRTWALRLGGQTSWAAGAGELRFANSNVLPQAALWVDATGVFTDHGAGAGTRTIGAFQAVLGEGRPLMQVDGVYRKAGGSGDTSIEIDLAVAGELAVDQGSITLWSFDKSITGRLSTAPGATLRSPARTLNLVGAQVANNGSVEIGDVGLAANAHIDANTLWTGSGSLSVVGAQNLNFFSVVTNDGSVQTGRLQLREHTRLLGSGSFETVTLSIRPAEGSFVAFGTLAGTVGPSVSASGTAVLGGQLVVWGGSRLALDGDSSWDSRSGSDALVFVDNPFGGAVDGRNSRLSIGAGGVFRDEACTAPCERSIQGPNVPGGELVIAGSYVKRGEHRTSLGSGLQFSNSGRIVAQQGQLRLYGVDNSGTLHADGGHVRVSGLAQWQSGTQTLRGGTYRVNTFGTMALELGSDAQPLRIRVNEATVLLDGPQATLLNRVNDDLAVDAMAGLAEQRGSLQLTGGAQLLLGAGGLQQSGNLLIGAGSRLRTEGVFRQTGGATWLDGLLQAGQVVLNAGRFGAGDADRIGQGQIEAAVWGAGRRRGARRGPGRPGLGPHRQQRRHRAGRQPVRRLRHPPRSGRRGPLPRAQRGRRRERRLCVHQAQPGRQPVPRVGRGGRQLRRPPRQRRARTGRVRADGRRPGAAAGTAPWPTRPMSTAPGRRPEVGPARALESSCPSLSSQSFSAIAVRRTRQPDFPDRARTPRGRNPADWPKRPPLQMAAGRSAVP